MYTPKIDPRNGSKDLLSLDVYGNDKGNSGGTASPAPRKEANYQNGNIERSDVYTAYSIFWAI